MAFLAEYGMFLAKLSTVLLMTIIVIGAIFFIVARSRDEAEHLHIKNINDKYETMSFILKSRILGKKALKKYLKEQKQKHKEKEKDTEDKHRVFVLHFKGDIRASSVSSLREEVTAILTIADKHDEVVALIESGGGTVHGYGLAASQLRRIRDKGIMLTASVDKVAASGGYMMTCVADRIIAAPFAIVGSIGVLAQIPNFHRLLKKMDIDFEQITAGDYKRTLTFFGENTEQDREKFKQEIEDTHKLFKEFVADNRQQVDIEKIATGEHWYGKRAIELKLVDELVTSDDYLVEAAKEKDIYEVSYDTKRNLSEKLFSMAMGVINRLDEK